MEHHEWSGLTVPAFPFPTPRISPARMEDLEARMLLSGDGLLNVPVAPLDEGGGSPAIENDAPTANNDEVVGDQGRLIDIPNVLANDTDPEGDRLRVVGHTQANDGVVIRLWGGRFVYRPAAGFAGSDSFEYFIGDGHGNTAMASVLITVRAAEENTAPVAEDDDATGRQDTWIRTDDVLANDTDEDGDPLRVVGHTQGANGLVIYSGGGVFSYRPVRGFVGTDTFKYTVGDGRGGRDTGEVTITVEAAPENIPPDAVDDNATATAGQWTVIPSVLDNDSDLDGDRIHITDFTQPDVGRVMQMWGGKFLYFAPADADPDVDTSFKYTISDGRGGTDTATVAVDIQAPPPNEGPIAGNDAYTTGQGHVLLTGNVLANDSDPDGGRIRIVRFTQAAHGTVSRWGCERFLYVPDPDFEVTGPAVIEDDTFTYTITDGQGGEATATVTIDITPPPANGLPDAVDDAFTMRPGAEELITGNVLRNDTDPDGDILRVIANADPQHGTVEYLGLGRFKYVPSPDYVPDIPEADVDDSFEYTVSDGRGGQDTATVTIDIVPNRDPDAVDDSFTARQDQPFLTPSVLKNDSDPEGHLLAITDYTQPAGGTVDHALFGHFRFVPNDGFTGETTFTYTIGDGHGGSATATVTIDVLAPPANQPPVAVGDTFRTRQDRAIHTPSVLANDSDPDRDWLRIVEVSGITEGATVIHRGGGCFYYKPLEGFTGQDTFTYTITDGQDTATATVTIIVDPLIDPTAPPPGGNGAPGPGRL